jgi:hypothetical protein
MPFVRVLVVAGFLLIALPPVAARAQDPLAATFHCSGSAITNGAIHPDSNGHLVDVQLDCGDPGAVTFTLPDGVSVQAQLTDRGRFAGTIGVAYVCEPSPAGVATQVTTDGGATWSSTLALTVEAAPACDYLLHEGVNRVTWTGESSPIVDAVHDRRFGQSPLLTDEERAAALDHIAVWQFDEHRAWPRGWGASVPAGAATLERLEPGQT